MVAFCSWSGGKDSCLALYRALKQGIPVTTLLTMLHEEGRVSRSHGIPRALLEAQAAALNKEIAFGAATWSGYEEEFVRQLKSLRNKGLEQAVFGDIDLAPHREWEERVCAKADFKASLPLWEEERRALVDEFLDAGFKAIVVSVKDESMSRFLGQPFDGHFVAAAEAMGWDACGEEGEFHTFVVDGPLFRRRIQYQLAETHRIKEYQMISLVPCSQADGYHA